MEFKKLKIYTSKNWKLQDKNTVLLLWPFWEFKELESSDPDFGRFNDLKKRGNELFELTENIDNAEVAVYPQEFSNTPDGLLHLQNIAEQVATAEKKIIVYYNSDDDSEIKIDNCILFRTSFYKSKQKENEFAIPGWSVDFIKYFHNETVTCVNEYKKPTVSYCGYVDYEKTSLKQTIRTVFNPPVKNAENYAKALRGKACRVLKANNLVNTNFIIRNGFWAGGITDKNIARKEYAQNMISSLYGIATRGGGNFSYRLYELLSCGRIPVFINTDAVLPFDKLINWKKHVVWVEEKEIGLIDKILLEFHYGKSPQELEEIQKSNRKLYEEQISPYGFHKQLALFIKSKI